MSRPYTAVLFDLDGTIVDSAPGITATLAATFERMSLPVPTPAELLAYVGPPILDSFRDLAGLDEETSDRALDIYRGLYLASGVFDATVYPGVAAVLQAIHAAGFADVAGDLQAREARDPGAAALRPGAVLR